VVVEVLASWNYACVCSCTCGLLLLLNYCRRGTTHAMGSCMCGNVVVVEVLSSWKYACVCSCMCGAVVVVELLSLWN